MVDESNALLTAMSVSLEAIAADATMLSPMSAAQFSDSYWNNPLSSGWFTGTRDDRPTDGLYPCVTARINGILAVVLACSAYNL